MNILICDDERIFTEMITKSVNAIVQKRGIKCRIMSCQSGEEVIALYKEHKPKAVFLDISMPGIDGFDVAEAIASDNSGTEIIFVSSKEEMVYHSYKFRPFWFVPKSQLDMLNEVMLRLFDKLEIKTELTSKININIEGRRRMDIDPYNIAYFMTESPYMQFVDKDWNVSESYRNKLENIENQLEEHNYVRIHVRYLVNCRFIRRIDENTCVFKNGKTLPVSRSRADKAMTVFQEYMRSVR